MKTFKYSWRNPNIANMLVNESSVDLDKAFESAIKESKKILDLKPFIINLENIEIIYDPHVCEYRRFKYNFNICQVRKQRKSKKV